MTLDKVIERLKKQVDTDTLSTCLNCDNEKTCDECEKNPTQIIEYLEELKVNKKSYEAGYVQAIDDFLRKLFKKSIISIHYYEYVEKFANELKESVKEDD